MEKEIRNLFILEGFLAILIFSIVIFFPAFSFISAIIVIFINLLIIGRVSGFGWIIPYAIIITSFLFVIIITYQGVITFGSILSDEITLFFLLSIAFGMIIAGFSHIYSKFRGWEI